MKIEWPCLQQRGQYDENPTSTSNLVRNRVNSACQQCPSQLNNLKGNYFNFLFIDRLKRDEKRVARKEKATLGKVKRSG